MGKRRYNAKARQVVKTDIDDSKTNEVFIYLTREEHYQPYNSYSAL